MKQLRLITIILLLIPVLLLRANDNKLEVILGAKGNKIDKKKIVIAKPKRHRINIPSPWGSLGTNKKTHFFEDVLPLKNNITKTNASIKIGSNSSHS